MSNYVIIEAPTTEELEEQVNGMIDEGFDPVGNIFVDRYVYDNARKGETVIEVVYFQAVYRKVIVQ